MKQSLLSENFSALNKIYKKVRIWGISILAFFLALYPGENNVYLKDPGKATRAYPDAASKHTIEVAKYPSIV